VPSARRICWIGRRSLAWLSKRKACLPLSHPKVTHVSIQPAPSALSSSRVAVSPEPPPRRSAPYGEEPGFSESSGLWLFGNVRLLRADLAYVAATCELRDPPPCVFDAIEREAEELVLAGKVLVCGVHSPAHQRAAVVPLRWGSPRIVVLSGGFRHHLGPNLTDEPFRAGRLWRYQWDPTTDLAISRRAPDKMPTFATHNPTVDRMVARIAQGEMPGLRSPLDLALPVGVIAP
jgi:hypothetical protein